MTARLHILFLLITCCISGNLTAQDLVAKYPFRFSQYTNCCSFVNPATAGCRSPRELNIGNQRMFGAISHVSASYLTFHLRLQQGIPNKPFSSAGVILYNDREGKYLNRTRFYASYAWHASLSRKLKFSAGLYVGGMNYSVKGTPLSGDGSDTKADGAVGVSFYSNAFQADLSFGQIFSSKVQPLEEVTVLSPMINISINRIFIFEENFMLTPSLTARIPFENESDDKIKPLCDVNLLMALKKKLLFSAGIHNNSMVVIAAGITNLTISEGELGVMVSYAFHAWQQTTIKTSVGEVGINYYF